MLVCKCQALHTHLHGHRQGCAELPSAAAMAARNRRAHTLFLSLPSMWRERGSLAGVRDESGNAVEHSSRPIGDWETLEASRDDTGFIGFDGGNYCWSPVSLLAPPADQASSTSRCWAGKLVACSACLLNLRSRGCHVLHATRELLALPADQASQPSSVRSHPAHSCCSAPSQLNRLHICMGLCRNHLCA